MSSVITREEKQIARPLKVLVALIKEDLRQEQQAAEQAGMPYRIASGAKMIEARDSHDLKGIKLIDWAKRNFDLSSSAIRYRIKLAESQGYGVSTVVEEPKSFKTMDDFRRHIGESRPTSGAVRRDWTAPVDDIAERARRDALRLREADLTRQQEREAERVLGLKLIDIGYKVLAKELHPDKGGSRETMQRLSRVRDRLKAGV